MNSNSSTYLSYSNPIENTSLLNTSMFDFTVELNPQLSFNKIHSIKNLKKIVTISKIHSEKFCLKRPLAIIVSEEDSEFKAEYPSLELYAFGENEDDTINELLSDFIDLCETVLNHNFNELGIYPKVWLRILNTLIK